MLLSSGGDFCNLVQARADLRFWCTHCPKPEITQQHRQLQATGFGVQRRRARREAAPSADRAECPAQPRPSVGRHVEIQFRLVAAILVTRRRVEASHVGPTVSGSLAEPHGGRELRIANSVPDRRVALKRGPYESLPGHFTSPPACLSYTHCRQTPWRQLRVAHRVGDRGMARPGSLRTDCAASNKLQHNVP